MSGASRGDYHYIVELLNQGIPIAHAEVMFRGRKKKGGLGLLYRKRGISIKGSFLSLDQYSRHRLKQNECFGL